MRKPLLLLMAVLALYALAVAWNGAIQLLLLAAFIWVLVKFNRVFKRRGVRR